MDLLVKRIEGLTSALKILCGLNPENVERCSELWRLIHNLKQDIKVSRNLIERCKADVKEMMQLCERLDALNTYLNDVDERIPDIEPEERDERLKNNVTTMQKMKPEKQHMEVVRTTIEPKKQRAEIITTKIETDYGGVRHVTVQELNSLHKYMRGRLTVEEINSFIDVLNSVLKMKYEILAQPRTALKTTEQQLQGNWKNFNKQTGLPPGSLFCTGNDFMLLKKHKLTKSCFSKLVVLRHLKFIKEARSGTETLYVV